MKIIIFSPVLLALNILGWFVVADDFKPLLIFSAALVTVWGGWKVVVEVKKSVYKPVTDVSEKVTKIDTRITESNESNLKLIASLRTDFSELKQNIKDATRERTELIEKLKEFEKKMGSVERWIAGTDELKQMRQAEIKELKDDIHALERMDNKILQQVGNLSKTL